MTWFETLFGFAEASGDQVREQLQIKGDYLHSAANGKRWKHGHLDIVSLKTLRERVDKLKNRSQPNIFQDAVGHTRSLHQDPANASALFQVASQFNLLEMLSPQVTPEHGITNYERDRTQGPASAMCTGAATAYRNYLIPVEGKAGQSQDRQINCISRLHEALVSHRIPQGASEYWSVENGYLFANASQLDQISAILRGLSQPELIALQGQLEFGFVQDAQVTLENAQHCVSQIYCPVLPIGYNHTPIDRWEPFARFVLTAHYEATLCAGLLNQIALGSSKVFLTRVGDDVFENPPEWIDDAISAALTRVPQAGLSVNMVLELSADAPALDDVEPVA